MITISDALLPEHVVLEFAAPSLHAAMEQMAALLKKHPHVEDWEEFHGAMTAHPPCIAARGEFAICIPHARTEGVSEIVMSAGRFSEPPIFPGSEFPVRYIFCIGVPQALASDYLRIAGALMRVLSDVTTEAALHAARTKSEFVDALAGLEVKL